MGLKFNNLSKNFSFQALGVANALTFIGGLAIAWDKKNPAYLGISAAGLLNMVSMCKTKNRDSGHDGPSPGSG